MTRREHCWNLLQMASRGHTSAGLWRDRRDTGIAHHSIKDWLELASTAERRLFDPVFIADVIGEGDLYRWCRTRCGPASTSST